MSSLTALFGSDDISFLRSVSDATTTADMNPTAKEDNADTMLSNIIASGVARKKPHASPTATQPTNVEILCVIHLLNQTKDHVISPKYFATESKERLNRFHFQWTRYSIKNAWPRVRSRMMRFSHVKLESISDSAKSINTIRTPTTFVRIFLDSSEVACRCFQGLVIWFSRKAWMDGKYSEYG